MSRPLVIAHRGDHGAHAENSVSALLAAVERGCDGVEFDIRLSADAVPMVIHDEGLQRCYGQDLRVGDTSADALRRCGVPSLDEVIDALSPAARLLIEIKQSGETAVSAIPAVQYVLEQHGRLERVEIMSFWPAALAESRLRMPDIPTVQLLSKPEHYITLREMGYPGCASVGLPLDLLSDRRIAECHAADRRVYLWTIRSRMEAQRAMGAGADLLITDDPGDSLIVAHGLDDLD